jgi:Cu+-exporting ATPase
MPSIQKGSLAPFGIFCLTAFHREETFRLSLPVKPRLDRAFFKMRLAPGSQFLPGMSSNAGNLLTDFSFLDLKEFKGKYASGPDRNQMRFYIGGIRCGKCVRKLEDLPLRLNGLRRCEVEMGSNLAYVEIDPEVLDFSQVAKSISEMGFDPIPLSLEQGSEAAEKREDRREIIRLAVAGACAGNIMTFAIATYVGAAGNWSSLFAWLSLVLYLPVVTYVAFPFYRAAWLSLKQRQLSIDLPMAVASFAGFLFSVVELSRGRSDFYFDSLSGFLFLILIARFVQKRLQRTYLRPRELSEGLQLQKVRMVNSNGWTWRPLEVLVPGDRILLEAPELLPAEAELVSNKAYFSMAWLSGEPKPKTFLRGATIPAGARLISGTAQLVVQRSLAQTAFGRILSEVQRFTLSRNRIVGRADRWSQYLLLTVFTIAVAFLALYWSVSPEEAIRRSLALIILACPCAMAFGTPLALVSAIRQARRHGLVIRDANVLEKANEVKTVFFDKTGTLTDTDLSLVTDPSSISHVYQKIILSLENESLHPIAFAFRKSFAAPAMLPPVDGFKEMAGSGVSGYIYGRFYELKRDGEAGAFSCALYEDEKLVTGFKFEARLKPDCASVLGQLRQRGYRVHLLSGDNEEGVHHMAMFLGFGPGEAHFGQTPESKAGVVAQAGPALMIGDGINDSLALMRAHVGVAVSGGVEAALKSAQVYIGEPGLTGVIHLLETSEKAMATIRQNLLISVIYNLTGGTLALLGFVNPLVAAVLMPLSSGFILLSTWWRGRR